MYFEQEKFSKTNSRHDQIFETAQATELAIYKISFKALKKLVITLSASDGYSLKTETQRIIEIRKKQVAHNVTLFASCF